MLLLLLLLLLSHFSRVCKTRNKGKLSLSLASLPVTKGAHSRSPVLAAGFVESQCRHLGWALRRVSTRAFTMGLLGLSSRASLPWGPHDLCVLASPPPSISILFSVTLPFFFFFSLSPNRHYASIPIKLGVFAIEWTHSHVH